MNVVTARHLNEAAGQHPSAAKEIQAWYSIARAARWRNFAEVRQVFKDADSVGEYVIFNVLHNRYRRVTIILYSREREGRITEAHIYIRSFLTHKQYDDRENWDSGVKK